jgi:methylmalonyl-CoA/ethylmalonyl-CoA epimerase
MKGSTTVWPVAARSSIPPSTAPIQTATPDGHNANGARHAREDIQAMAAPARNGHAVVKAPETISPRAWASRPMTAKTRIRRTSASAAGIHDLDDESMLLTVSGMALGSEVRAAVQPLPAAVHARDDEQEPADRPSLEDALRFVQVAQHAKDLQRAAAFYSALLNTQPRALFDPPGLLFFDVGGIRLLLERGAPSALIYLEVGDLHGTVAELRSRAVRIIAEPHLIFTHDDDTLGPQDSEEWMAFIEDSEANTLGLVSRVRTVGE